MPVIYSAEIGMVLEDDIKGGQLPTKPYKKRSKSENKNCGAVTRRVLVHVSKQTEMFASFCHWCIVLLDRVDELRSVVSE